MWTACSARTCRRASRRSRASAAWTRARTIKLTGPITRNVVGVVRFRDYRGSRSPAIPPSTASAVPVVKEETGDAR
jgi:hypothetical protein